jgi:hypothetical protein
LQRKEKDERKEFKRAEEKVFFISYSTDSVGGL